MTVPGTRPSSGPCGPWAPARGQSGDWIENAERSSFNSTNYGNTTANSHTFTNNHFHLRREQNIRARTKLYHAETLPAFYSFAPPLPTNNSAGQDPGNLSA